MDLLDVLGGERSRGRLISLLIGALVYDALKGRGRLADTLAVGPPSGGGFRGVLFDETGRNVLTTGLRDLLDRFRQNGQWDRAQSWIAIGPNRPIAPHELSQALGEDCVRWLIQETAIPRDELMAGLGGALPELVDKLTPDGRVPIETITGDPRLAPMNTGLSSLAGTRQLKPAVTLPRNAGPLTILIVEDEIILRMATSDELRKAGLFVIEAANGDDALVLLRNFPNIDAVFSDVRMPGTIDGVRLAELVKLHYPNIRMFLTSGTMDAFSTNRALADGYFSKPYVSAEVERAIRLTCGAKGS